MISSAAKHAQPAVACNTGSIGSETSLRGNAAEADVVEPQGLKMPLPANVSRCLAHGHRRLEWCDHREDCARHVSIRHDTAALISNAEVYNRACSDDQYLLRMPLTGLPKLSERE